MCPYDASVSLFHTPIKHINLNSIWTSIQRMDEKFIISPGSVFSPAQYSWAHCVAAPLPPLPQSDRTAPCAHVLSVWGGSNLVHTIKLHEGKKDLLLFRWIRDWGWQTNLMTLISLGHKRHWQQNKNIDGTFIHSSDASK